MTKRLPFFLNRTRMLSLNLGLLAAVLALNGRLAAQPVPTSAEAPTPSLGWQAVAQQGIPSVLAEDPAAAEPAAVDPDPLAPGLDVSFGALNFDGNSPLNGGFLFIPPDPIGAAGPNHVLNVVNCAVQWFTKAGANQYSQGLSTFFAPLAPVNTLFDPKALYDQYNGRFLVVALEQTSSPQASRILVAVSDDSDPNGTWYYLAINSKLNIGGLDRWADYPGFAVDAQAVYVSANMFSFPGSFGGVRLWIINKTPFYSGGAGTVTVHDPYAGGGQATTTQPTHMYGTAPGSMGTFLVSYSGLSDGVNEYVQIVRVDNPITGPTFSQQYVLVGDIDNTASGIPSATQLGSATGIATNDRRALNAVWRNNALYISTTIRPGSGVDANQATAHWWKLDTTTLAAIGLADQGNVGGEDIAVSAHTFFPAVTVDAFGNMAIGFSVSAPTIYASAAYTARLAGDPAGTVQPAGILAAGTDFYVRTFGGSRNRWGDYSGMSLDPADEVGFWVFNEYAMARGTVISGEDGRWATRWGRFQIATPDCSVSGPTDVCANTTGNLYSSTATAGATHSWSISGNGTIVGPTTGSSVSVTAGAGGSYTLTDTVTLGTKTSTCQTIVTVTAASTMVNTQVSILRSGVSRALTQKVSIRNISGSAINGPVSLVLDNLPVTVTLVNATGSTVSTTPAGQPYIAVNVGGDNKLTPGETVTVTLQFSNPSNVPITFATRVLSGTCN